MLILAAALLFALGIAHSYLGEKYILIRLFRREDLPKIFGSSQFTTQTLRFVWHITTIAWFGFVMLLVQIQFGNLTPNLTVQIIGYTCLTTGLFPLIMTKGKHLSWIVFFVVGGILLFFTNIK